MGIIQGKKLFLQKQGRKNKMEEFVRYLIVGTTTVCINTISYHIFSRVLSIHYLVSTIIAWLIAVLFAFLANKFFVFQKRDIDFKVVLKEFILFIMARLTTGALDVAVMWLGVSILGQNDLLIKIISNGIVIVLNYILGKFLVFN